MRGRRHFLCIEPEVVTREEAPRPQSYVQSIELHRVSPGDLLESLRTGMALEERERLSREALARESAVALPHPASIGASAVAAEHQLVRMALEEAGGKIQIARQAVTPRVCREVAVDVRVVGEDAVGEPAGLHAAGRIAGLFE